MKPTISGLIRAWQRFFPASRDVCTGFKPVARDVEPPDRGKVIAIPEVGGLHHRYRRAARARGHQSWLGYPGGEYAQARRIAQIHLDNAVLDRIDGRLSGLNRFEDGHSIAAAALNGIVAMANTR